MKQWENKLHCSGQFNVTQSNGDMIVIKDAEYSKMVFDSDKYHGESEMYAAISAFLNVLMRSDCIVRVRQEESLVIVEYTHNNAVEYFGGTELMFLSEDEAQLIEDYRHEDQRTVKELLEPVSGEKVNE